MVLKCMNKTFYRVQLSWDLEESFEDSSLLGDHRRPLVSCGIFRSFSSHRPGLPEFP